MKVLFAASEAHPFIKTGGLGDVMGALPQSLTELGVEARVVIPKYKNIKDELKQNLQFIKWFTVPVGWRNQYCGIFQYEYKGVIYYEQKQKKSSRRYSGSRNGSSFKCRNRDGSSADRKQ